MRVFSWSRSIRKSVSLAFPVAPSSAPSVELKRGVLLTGALAFGCVRKLLSEQSKQTK